MMNKKSKRRAFFVCAIMCLLYVSVSFRLPQKMSMTRTSDERQVPSEGMMMPVAGAETGEQKRSSMEKAAHVTVAPAAARETEEKVKAPEINHVQTVSVDAAPDVKNEKLALPGGSGVEPSILISIPLVCYAIREGWVEKESLIFGKKDAYNNVRWRKPIEILKDHDEEGIRNILTTIGQKRVLEFMKEEGISPKSGLSAEDLMLGKGYQLDKEKLLSLYEKHVGNTCDEIFPFSVKELGIAKGARGFQLTTGKEGPRDVSRSVEAEWMMPNLTSLPMRLAVKKLAAHTSRVKVYGSGHVVSQSPKAFSRLTGEQECIIQGKGLDE
ncbi:MAG: hypothetical protein A4E57_01059 [Syntrophorhabdaceae bacterium PtaU1.Bin034]|nr:MAG: hypothetical protein A4E57_01059 [Syntrophorhabdaceae bacterium PtaU1.Bin034]